MMNMISSIIIYVPMILLVYACINPGGTGLFRLRRLSRDLKYAASLLQDANYCHKLEQKIRNGSSTVPGELFQTAILKSQMEQYCHNIHRMQLNSNDKCQADIDSYFSHDFLAQQGKVDFCEHTTNGLTALGLLGTFFGLTIGLTSFGKDTSDQILTGISGLLDGMNVAFVTSICGIILSLVLGTALRVILSEAENNLELFLERFHSHVMQNQSEAAFNELIQHIVSVESSLNASNEVQLTALDRVAAAFIDRISQEMGLQIGALRTSIQSMSQEQYNQVDALKQLNTQTKQLGNELQHGLTPIVEEGKALTSEIKRANTALKAGMKQIIQMCDADAEIMARQKEIFGELSETMDSLQQMAESVQQVSAKAIQSVDTIDFHCQQVIQNTQNQMNAYLDAFATASQKALANIQNTNVTNLEVFQRTADDVVRHIAQNNTPSPKLDTLIQQNKTLIEQQQTLIRLAQQNGTKKVRRGWRK